MKIAIGADHGGFELKQALAEHLKRGGHQVQDWAPTRPRRWTTRSTPARWPRRWPSGAAERGIMIDGAGIGSSHGGQQGARRAGGHGLRPLQRPQRPRAQRRQRADPGRGPDRGQPGRADRRRLPDHRLHRAPAPAPGGHDHRRRAAGRGAAPVAAPRPGRSLGRPTWPASSSALRGCWAAAATPATAVPAWAPAPTRPASSSSWAPGGSATARTAPAASPRTWPATSTTPS